MNFEELALKVAKSIGDDYAPVPLTPEVLEFARRLREEWVKSLEPVAWVTPTAYLTSVGRNSVSAWNGVKTDAHTIPLYTLEKLSK